MPQEDLPAPHGAGIRCELPALCAHRRTVQAYFHQCSARRRVLNAKSTRVDPDLRDGLAEIYIRCLTYAYGALPCLGGSGWLMCIEEKYSELENFIFLISS